MSKQVKAIAGCELPSGERLALRRVDDRVGPTLISSHLELCCGETVLATSYKNGLNSLSVIDIYNALRGSNLPLEDQDWMLGHLRSAVKS